MKRALILLIIGSLLLIATALSTADEVDNRFVLFIIDQVSLNQIEEADTPQLDLLIEEGALGLMNTRTASSLDATDSYLTIGAGRRAVGGEAANYSFTSHLEWKDRKIKTLYRAQSGYEPGIAEVLNIRWAEIINSNLSGAYQAQAGFLGTRLEEVGKNVAVIGNTDYLDQKAEHKLGREAALIGINNQGRLKLGDVGQRTLLDTDQYPFIFLSDHDYLLDRFREYSSRAQLIVVESGDTARAETLADYFAEPEFSNFKKQSLERADKLLGKIVSEMDLEQERIMVITPTPTALAKSQDHNLTLAILAGQGIESGLLSTGTIKRSGLISSLDIAPTILSSLGLESDLVGLTGNPISSLTNEQPLAKLRGLDQQIRKTFNWRPVLIKFFILSQIVILALSALVIIFKFKAFFPLSKLLEYLLLSLLIIPLLFLFSSFFLNFSLYLVLIIFLLLSLFFSYLLKKIEFNSLDPILITANLTVILLSLDLWLGMGLIKSSVLGYSPVIGARFYGLGNEFMGLLIGAALIGITGFFDRFPILKAKLKYTLAFLFFMVVITVGHPRLGANFGGLITAAVALMLTYLLLIDYRFDLKSTAKALVFLALIIVGVIAYDLLVPLAESTHVGRTILLIRDGGFEELLSIISRKLSMNLRLLRWTIWTQGVLAFVIMLGILFRYPLGVVKDIIEDYPHLRYGFSGVVCGSIVTMLVNDSGVVATATLLLFPVLSFVYLVLQRIELES